MHHTFFLDPTSSGLCQHVRNRANTFFKLLSTNEFNAVPAARAAGLCLLETLNEMASLVDQWTMG